MAKQSSTTPPAPVWRNATVVAAAITALAVVAVALINANDTPDEDGPQPKTTITDKTGLSVLSVGSQALTPPPRVKYIFAGDGVTGDDDVYILAKYVPSNADPPVHRTEISPVGKVKANGTWLVEWTFPALPVLADFKAFAVAPFSECPDLECASPPPSHSTSLSSSPPPTSATSGTVTPTIEPTATPPIDPPRRLNALAVDRLLDSQRWRGTAIRAAVSVAVSPTPLPRSP